MAEIGHRLSPCEISMVDVSKGIWTSTNGISGLLFGDFVEEGSIFGCWRILVNFWKLFMGENDENGWMECEIALFMGDGMFIYKNWGKLIDSSVFFNSKSINCLPIIL
jgi:hypothetical protein